MSHQDQCNITLQDCASLYEGNDPPYQHGSCVKDPRLNIGRCGWPGAACTIKDGYSNCQDGASVEVCQKGVCVGAVGSVCHLNASAPDAGALGGDDSACSGFAYCNGTLCGGNGALFLQYDSDTIPNDACMSNSTHSAFDPKDGSLVVLCGPSAVTITFTVQPSSSVYPASTAFSASSTSTSVGVSNNTAAIAGGTAGAAVVLALLLLLFLLRRKSRRATQTEMSETNTAQGHHRINSAEIFAQVERMTDGPNRQPVIIPSRLPLVILSQPDPDDGRQSSTGTSDSQSRLLPPAHMPTKGALRLVSSPIHVVESAATVGTVPPVVEPTDGPALTPPVPSIEDTLRQLALDSERRIREAENTRNMAVRALSGLRERDSISSGSVPPGYQS